MLNRDESHLYGGTGLSSPGGDVAGTSSAMDVSYSEAHKHRKKRRERRADEADEIRNNENVVNGQSTIKDDEERYLPPDTKFRKKRKKKKRLESVDAFPVDSIQTDIMHLKQNIICASDDSAIDGSSPKRQVWHTNVESQPSGKVFIESRGGFKAMEKWKLAQKLALNLSKAQGDQNLMTPGCPTLELGLSLHCYTKRLANYCQGILAGFALWQCVMVYRLASPSFSSQDFVEHYSSMASPAQALFYVLPTLCLVSVMGRCNFGNFSSEWFQKIRNFKAGLVALLVYLAILSLSLYIADYDEKLALHVYNSTIRLDDYEIESWKRMNLFRCVGAMVAWLMLAVSPDHDFLYDSIRDLAEDQAQ